MDSGPSSQFDRYASDYEHALNQGIHVSGYRRDHFILRRISYLARILRQIAANQPIISVLDFGCSDGSTAPVLQEYFAPQRIVGVDSSDECILRARAMFGDHVASFESSSEYRPEATFDLCHTNGVFHHIPPDQRSSAVDLVFSSLVPGGYVALFENNPWNPGTRYVMSRIPFDRDARPMTPPAARSMLVEGGFSVLLTRSLFLFPSALALLHPLEDLLGRYPIGAQYLVLARKPGR